MYNAMKNSVFILLLIGCSIVSTAQSLSAKLASAYRVFEKDPQLRSAIASICVMDAETGKIVFEKNSKIGLAPASTLKIITAATAYEVLGKDFQYSTQIGYSGKIEDSALHGSLYILPSGDPTLGSTRWISTNSDSVIGKMITSVKRLGIKKYNSIIVDGTGWEGETIPGGWIWEDIGNYYGAGAEVLNWMENRYELIMQSGKNIGDPIIIKGTRPTLYSYSFISYVRAAAKGTGDNAIIYFPTASSQGTVRGTIPADEKNFIISGAMPSAKNQFVATISDLLSNTGIQRLLTSITIDSSSTNKIKSSELTIFHRETSPPLDSIVFYFLKRSINLYGEALARTFAQQKKLPATTENGSMVIKEFWSNKNIKIDNTELNIRDGSGLAPLNRVTTHAQVHILQYAKKQSWFSGFFNGFPEYNNMKMKSGNISGVKAYCGYHTAKNGRQYIFSFLVNNFNGSASSLNNKMYKVLDVLK